MTASQAHPMLAVSNHDELAEQQFVLALKGYIYGQLDPKLEKVITEKIVPDLESEGQEQPAFREIRRKLDQHSTYRNWVTMTRAAQELMWQTSGDCVDRQEGELEEIASKATLGSVRVDPEFEVPAYLAAMDTHLMPGSYYTDITDTDVRQGAVFDKGASLYSLGRQGGQLNDMRGHTVVGHLFERFPDFEPQRILEMGCSAGFSLVAVSSYFPDAEVYGIDVGGSMLRYAHARAAHLGATIHFSQQNAEQTDFEDGSFDLVFSSATLHETSAKAIKKIMHECYRVLKPGGLMIHLEVPLRHSKDDYWGQLRGDYESRYNNEPFWAGAVSADFGQLAGDAGFEHIAFGHQDAQDARKRAERGQTGNFGSTYKGVYQSWYLASGRKPADSGNGSN